MMPTTYLTGHGDGGEVWETPELDRFVGVDLTERQARVRAEDAHWHGLHHEAYVVVQQIAKLPTHAELTARRRTYTPWSGPAEPWPEEVS